MFNSVKFKISVLYSAILGLVLVVYSGILYLNLHYTLYNDLDDELKTKARQINFMIGAYQEAMGANAWSLADLAERVINLREEEQDSSGRLNELEREWFKIADKLDLTEDYIGILNLQGEVIAASDNLQPGLISLFAKNIPQAPDNHELTRNIKFNKRNLRLILAPFVYKADEKYIIQIATSVRPIIYILQNRMRTITIGIPVALVLTSFIGWLLAAKILRPVSEITKTARKITHENLGARVKTERIDKEMRYLVEAFNEMILRLEKSFAHIAEFSSYVAHELKTPLAIIRGESELALRKERSGEEYRRTIAVNLEETKRMIKVIEDLLMLAKLDYRPELFKFEQVELTAFLKEIYEQSKILVATKNITVGIDMPSGPINIDADRLHLRRLFFNLVHNAIKFNSANGRIEISLTTGDKTVSISIRDTGIGINDKDLPKIFNPFFHTDRPGQDAASGSGLGLAIAQSIAKIHQGRIEVSTQPQAGSAFTVILPTR